MIDDFLKMMVEYVKYDFAITVCFPDATLRNMILQRCITEYDQLQSVSDDVIEEPYMNLL